MTTLFKQEQLPPKWNSCFCVGRGIYYCIYTVVLYTQWFIHTPQAYGSLHHWPWTFLYLH